MFTLSSLPACVNSKRKTCVCMVLGPVDETGSIMLPALGKGQ